MSHISKAVLFGLFVTVALVINSEAQRGRSVAATDSQPADSSTCTACTGSCAGLYCCDGVHTICGVSGNTCRCYQNPGRNLYMGRGVRCPPGESDCPP